MILASDIARSVSGPYLGACALLVIAGIGKVHHPVPTRAAVRAVGLGMPRAGIVAFGAAEILTGVIGGLFGGRGALAVAALYLVLTAFAAALMLRAPATPCACLGSTGSVVTGAHVAIDVVAMSIAVAAAGGASPFARLSGGWFSVAVFVALVACCVKLSALTLEELPRLTAAAREGRA